MKIALLGKGKTGSQVRDLRPTGVEVFDQTNLPSFEKLIKCDVVISFLPGEAFEDLIPLLLETKLPVVTGSTGFNWPENFDLTLKEKNLKWIHATNFSLGVVVMKQLIERLNQVSHLFGEKTFEIHEVHHTKKLDAPSGTALSMKGWLHGNPKMTFERTGDVVGLHTLTLKTPSEIIKLTHEAKNRQLFAEGALWASDFIKTKTLAPGLHAFQKVVEDHLAL
ncbi:MAG TPA: dihydrodipicolinate reductase C-terminal domain-containing protein [Bacteriovoracaceae bacterium]|nr:dihydrodipicolinate reductase C-terminal domain-containing protein [Bacteriovoracaceae bacterium]